MAPPSEQGADWTPGGPAPRGGSDNASATAGGWQGCQFSWGRRKPPISRAVRAASRGRAASVAVPIVPAESALIVPSRVGLQALASGKLGSLFQQPCPPRSCQLNGPRRTAGSGGGGLLLPDPRREGLAQPRGEAGLPPGRRHPETQAAWPQLLWTIPPDSVAPVLVWGAVRCFDGSHGGRKRGGQSCESEEAARKPQLARCDLEQITVTYLRYVATGTST